MTEKIILIVTYPELTLPYVEYIDPSIQYLEKQIRNIVETSGFDFNKDIEMIEKLLKDGINERVRVILEYGGMTGYDVLYVLFVINN
jgi:hypothetical protein